MYDSAPTMNMPRAAIQATDEKPSPVGLLLTHINQELSMLEESALSFFRRIEPVLSPSTPRAETNGRDNGGHMAASALATTLESIRSRIAMVRSHLNETAERIEA